MHMYVLRLFTQYKIGFPLALYLYLYIYIYINLLNNALRKKTTCVEDFKRIIQPQCFCEIWFLVHSRYCYCHRHYYKYYCDIQYKYLQQSFATYYYII